MKPVRVMVVEDDPEDMELMALELRRAGLSAELHRVETAEEMGQALRQNEWDAVISDYRLPVFSAPEALRLLQEQKVAGLIATFQPAIRF